MARKRQSARRLHAGAQVWREDSPRHTLPMPRDEKTGRCRLHGGLSTGYKTDEGFWAIHDAHYKHGYYTKRAKHQRQTHREISGFLRGVKPVLRALYPKPRPI